MSSRAHRNQPRPRTVPNSADNPAPAPADRSIGPRDILRLQRLVGNRAVRSAVAAGASGYVVQRALISVEEWRQSHDEELVRGVPFLKRLEKYLKLYYEAAGGRGAAAKKSVVRALSILMLADSPGRVDPGNIKIKRYVLRGMASEARSLLQNMTGPDDRQAKLEFTAEEHAKDRRFVQTILDEGSRQTGDTLLRNACEWILTGRTPLYVFTRTGDWLERASASGKGAKIPHVPDNFLNRGHMRDQPNPIYKSDKLDSKKNIRYLAKEEHGFAGAGYIGIARPREAGRASVEETLRHEVQHVADRSAKVQAGSAKESAKYLFENYATEYRAYSYEGPTFRHLSNDRRDLVRHSKAGSAEYDWTARQWAIFEKIYAQYKHTQDGWNGDLPDALAGMSFRQAVLSYIDPDDRGFNRLNSVRIDDFYNALDQVPLGTTDESLNPVQDLKARALALERDEARHINTPGRPMRNKLEEHLGDAALQEITATLKARYGQLRQLKNAGGTRNLKQLVGGRPEADNT